MIQYLEKMKVLTSGFARAALLFFGLGRVRERSLTGRHVFTARLQYLTELHQMMHRIDMLGRSSIDALAWLVEMRADPLVRDVDHLQPIHLVGWLFDTCA